MVPALKRQQDSSEVKDWRSRVEELKAERMKAGGRLEQLEEELKEIKGRLAAREEELEGVVRKLETAKATNDDLETKLTDMSTNQETTKEEIFLKVEEVRVRTSDVMRLDQVVTAKERRLEETSNALIEAEKKIFDFEISVKSLKSRLEQAEGDNERLRAEGASKTGLLEERSLKLEEAARREKVLRSEHERQMSQMEADQMEEATTKQIRGDFMAARTKFETVEEAKPKCEGCVKLQDSVEEAEENIRKCKSEVEEISEELRRSKEQEVMMKGQLEDCKQVLVEKQVEVKQREADNTNMEVELGRARIKMSTLEVKVEELANQTKVGKEELEAVMMVKEEQGRTGRVVQEKLGDLEEKQLSMVEENFKLKKECDEKSDELNMVKQRLIKSENDSENCQFAREDLKRNIDTLKESLEEAQKTIKMEIYENNVNEEKVRKLGEKNEIMKLKMEESEEKLEQAEKALKMTNVALDKAEEDMAEEKWRSEQEKRDMEEQMKALVEMI